MSSKPRRFPVPRRHGDVRTRGRACASSSDELGRPRRAWTGPRLRNDGLLLEPRAVRVFSFPIFASPRFGPETHRLVPPRYSSFRTDQRDQLANSRQNIRKLVKDGFVIRKPQKIRFARACATCGEAEGIATQETEVRVRTRAPALVLWLRRHRVLRRLLKKYREAKRLTSTCTTRCT